MCVDKFRVSLKDKIRVSTKNDIIYFYFNITFSTQIINFYTKKTLSNTAVSVFLRVVLFFKYTVNCNIYLSLRVFVYVLKQTLSILL